MYDFTCVYLRHLAVTFLTVTWTAHVSVYIHTHTNHPIAIFANNILQRPRIENYTFRPVIYTYVYILYYNYHLKGLQRHVDLNFRRTCIHTYIGDKVW